MPGGIDRLGHGRSRHRAWPSSSGSPAAAGSSSTNGARSPRATSEVSYEQLQPDKSNPGETIPPAVLEMKDKDKQVFLKGYMMPTRQLTGLKRFTLCPTDHQCQFCNPDPSRTEMVRVTLEGDLTADYTTRLIGIGGRFQVDPKNPSGMPYAMSVDYLK